LEALKTKMIKTWIKKEAEKLITFDTSM